MRVEFGRPFVPVSFQRRDGTVREALTWVDTGGGAFQVAGPLASELGLVFEPIAAGAGEDEWECADPAPASLGGRRIDFGPNKVQRRKGRDAALIAPGFPAEAFLNGQVLMRHTLRLDYPRAVAAIAAPGDISADLPFELPTTISAAGFPRIELEVDGDAFGFLLDTGAPFTMVSEAVLARWAARHHD